MTICAASSKSNAENPQCENWCVAPERPVSNSKFFYRTNIIIATELRQFYFYSFLLHRVYATHQPLLLHVKVHFFTLHQSKRTMAELLFHFLGAREAQCHRPKGLPVEKIRPAKQQTRLTVATEI